MQRFALELTRALDQKITAGGVPDTLKGSNWRIIVPKDVCADLDLRSIKIEHHGSGRSHIWEQTALAYEARHDLLLGFGGSGPVLHGRQLVVIHDAAIFRHPQTYSMSYRLFHTVLGFILARRAKLATVSGFSRQELSDVFRVPEADIAVIYNATDHFTGLQPDETILGRLQLEGQDFCLMVGTLKPSKNIKFALDAFTAWCGKQKLVVAGGPDSKVFESGNKSERENILFPGRLTDPEIAALERHAMAFIFPSLYEGFGIPPLEAMTQGCPVLAADIPAVREACGPAALYFNPQRQDELVEALKYVSSDQNLRTRLIEAGRANVTRFSWDKSGTQLLEIISKL